MATTESILKDRANTLITSATSLEEVAYLIKGLGLGATSQVTVDAINAKVTSLSPTATSKEIAYVLKALDTTSGLSVDSGLDITKPYGLIWDDNADTYFRTGHTVPAVQQQMRRCVTSGSPEYGGAVQYYLDADNSALKEDGGASVLDGSTGLQVRVEIPKHYVASYKLGSLNYDIMSLTPFTGGKTHDRFKKAGWTDSGDGTNAVNEISHAYVGAFEGCHYDASLATMVNGTAVAPVALDLVNDKVYSVAGFKPLSTITRATARTLIANGGSKQYSWHDHDMIKRLFLVEYGTHNSQAMIAGYTENTAGASYDNDALKTGLTVSLGNNSGSISGSANHLAAGGDGGYSGVVANSFRGIENFFGHLWKWVDGINLTNAQPFISALSGTFADDIFTGDYIRAVDNDGLLVTQPTSDGYQSTLHNGTNFVKTVGASSLTKITDYYYYASGNRVLMSGGSLNNSSNAGVSWLHALSASSSVSWILCSRA